MTILWILFLSGVLFNVVVWVLLPTLSERKHEREMLAMKHNHEMSLMIQKYDLEIRGSIYSSGLQRILTGKNEK